MERAKCFAKWREAKTDRTQLRGVLDQIEAGGVLMVTWLDRLARSTRDLSASSARSCSDAMSSLRRPGSTRGRCSSQLADSNSAPDL
jgi:Resolvase, N terminal domain